MKSPGRILLLSAIVCVGVAAAIVLLVYRQPPLLTATLSDGTVLRLERVTFGRKHASSLIPNWRELKAMWTARSWSRRAYESEHETLGLWIVKEGGPANISVRIADHRLKNIAPYGLPGGLSFRPVHGFTRTGTHVLFDVEEFSPTGQAMRVATWKIPNPSPATPNRFKPVSVPVSQTMDGINIRLRKVNHERHVDGTATLLFRFDMFRNDFPTSFIPAYEPIRAELFDGTGNMARGRGMPYSTINVYGAELDPAAPAWRLRATLAPMGPSKTNVLWRLQIPGTTRPSSTFENTFFGSKVTLTGPTATRSGNGYVIHFSKPGYHVSIVDVADMDGVVSRRIPQPASVSATAFLLLAGPWWPAFSTNDTLRITLAIQQAKIVEFDFAPPENVFGRPN